MRACVLFSVVLYVSYIVCPTRMAESPNGEYPSLAHVFRVKPQDRHKLERALLKVANWVVARSPSKTIEDAVKDITDQVLDGSLTLSPAKPIVKRRGRKPNGEGYIFQNNFNARTQAIVKNAQKTGRRPSVDNESNSSLAQLKADRRKSLIIKKRKTTRDEKRVERLQKVMDCHANRVNFSDVSECDLSAKFVEMAQMLMMTLDMDPLDTYLTLVHALKLFYDGQTWQGNVNALLTHFLRKLLIDSDTSVCLRDLPFLADVSETEDALKYLRVLRLQTLLVYGSFIDSQFNDSQEDIIGKMADRLTARAFFGGASRLETVVDELTAEFVDVVPRQVGLLHDYVNLPRPVECESLESEDEVEPSPSPPPFLLPALTNGETFNKSRSSSVANDNIFKRLESVNSSSPPPTLQPSQTNRRSSGEGPKYNDWVNKHTSKTRLAANKANERLSSMNTTEEIMNGIEHSDDDDASSNSSRVSPRKHASSQALRKQMSYIDLVKKRSERRKEVSNIVERVGSVRSGGPRTSTPSSEIHETSSALQYTRPRRRLNGHIAPQAPRKTSSLAVSPRATVKRKATSPVDRPTSNGTEHKVYKDAYELPSTSVDHYKRYMSRIQLKRRKKDGQELFYSRGYSRPNVFDPPAEETRWNLRNRDTAKSRSGREVRGGKQLSHVANYLLNTLNPNPNSPIIPKNMARKLGSPFKVKKSLRMPSRSRSKQLKKMQMLETSSSKIEMISVDSTLTESDPRLIEGLLSPRLCPPKHRNSPAGSCSDTEEMPVTKSSI